jgi:hypothetical protein
MDRVTGKNNEIPIAILRYRREAWLLDDPHKSENIKLRKQRLCCEAR